jgi:hypothetical protein
MVGKPGKYISMEKGPIAESKPKIKINKDRSLLFILPVTIFIQIYPLAGWEKNFPGNLPTVRTHLFSGVYIRDDTDGRYKYGFLNPSQVMINSKCVQILMYVDISGDQKKRLLYFTLLRASSVFLGLATELKSVLHTG